MSEQEIYELCVTARINRLKNGHLTVRCEVSAETAEKIQQHESEIADALSGYCFRHDVYGESGLHNWLIAKRSVIAAVSYPPITVFEGTASEVDAWAKAHRDDPFFTDLYTSKYMYCRQE